MPNRKQGDKENTEDKKKKEEDYIGHRQRLKTRFIVDEGRSMPYYELLELVLTYAIPRRDVKPLAKALLRRYANLANVLVLPMDKVMKIDGVGENSAVLFSLIHACAKKISWENLENRDTPVLSNKQQIVEYCRSCIGYASQENLLIIYLNCHGKYMTQSIEQVGTINAVMISPRDIVAKALENNASGIIMAHNHPSGDTTPSKADIEMTRQVARALKSVCIKLEDHLIISPTGHYSIREKAGYVLLQI